MFLLGFPDLRASQYSTFRALHNCGQPRRDRFRAWTGRDCTSRIADMPVAQQITIAPNLTFDAITAGEPGAPLVLLLHGFAESMHCWQRSEERRVGKECRL